MTSGDPIRTITDAELAQMPAAEVIERLRVILGTKLVAYIAGVPTRSMLGRVDGGTIRPSDANKERLRAALRAADYLRQYEGSATVQSWFMGMNTDLDDQSPAKLLRDSKDQTADAAKVFTAARSFEQA